MKLRILFVDDSPDDVALMLRRLREAGMELEWDRVDTRAALDAALRDTGWEVALVDYNLPGFGGPEALSLLGAEAPDVPAITVSGAIDEDTAVTTMRAGAVDYVLKDNLTRLAPAVQRAVDGADLRHRQREAVETAKRTQFAIDHASQAIAYVSEDGVFLYKQRGRPSSWWTGELERPRPDDLGLEPGDRRGNAGSSCGVSRFGSRSSISRSLCLSAVGESRDIKARSSSASEETSRSSSSYVRDVTEQRRSERRAVESEARYERLADNAPDIIFRYDFLPTARLTYINPAVRAITGYTPEECYADPELMLTLAHPDDAPAMAAMLSPPSPPREPILMRWIGKDGVTRWMESAIVPVHDDEGHLVAVEGITRDITQSKHAQEELQASKQLLEGIMNALPVRVFWKDRDLVYVGCNAVFARDAGFSDPADVVGKDDYQMGWRDQADLYRADDRRVIESGRSTGLIEEPQTTPEGDTITLLTSKLPLLDLGGEIDGVLGAYMDITEHKRSEDALRESEERFEQFADHFPGYLFMQDEQLRYVYANRPDKADGEWLRREWLGCTPSQVWGGDPGKEEEDRVRRSLGGESVDTIVSWTPAGVHEFVHSIYFPIPREGKPPLVGGISIDVTEQVEAQDEVRRQAAQLRRTVEGAVQAMSQVVETRDPYTAGHERRVAELAMAIGEDMGVEADNLGALRLAGLIHDIGKIAVPAEILAKPGRLSAVEFNLIKQHPTSGYDILAPIDFGHPVAEMVLQHHERLDGSGYPGGLTGEEILLEARILAVADVVEAMSSHRPYRAALGMEAALSEVRDHAGVKYDAAVVAVCVRLVEEQGFAFTP